MNYQPEIYNKDWFEWQHGGAFLSAEVMLSYLFSKVIEPRSVIDIGCGTGAWLKVSELLGTTRILGLDGCTPEMTFLSEESYIQADFEKNLPDVDEKFDLAICLEVAEHLSGDCAATLVQKLCSYSDCILFSAAFPGQGGDGHINEQPIEYWIHLFSEQGYEVADVIRPALWGMPCIEGWYLYNTFIFYNKDNAKWRDFFFDYRASSLVPKADEKGSKQHWEDHRKSIITLSHEVYQHFLKEEMIIAKEKISLLKSLIQDLET